MQDALSTIDKVHGDGPLQSIPFTGTVSRGSRGSYRSDRQRGYTIGIKKGIDGPEMTVAHEVGHWLDYIGIPSPTKFASESNEPRMRQWQDAVKASAAYQKIQQRPPGQTRTYLLTLREAWARSYAQFVAQESQHPEMLKRLNAVRSGRAADAEPGISMDRCRFCTHRHSLS